MNGSLADLLGVEEQTFRLIMLPAFIFLARIIDVSINTVRIIFMLHHRKLLSTVLGFFEALIWLLAIGQIFQNMDSGITFLAYSGGFACGIWVGMVIEERLAIGRVVVQVITTKPAVELLEYFKGRSLRYSILDADSESGPVNVIYTVIKRDSLNETINTVRKYHPNAFYTVEGVKKASDDEVSDDKGFFFKRKLSKP